MTQDRPHAGELLEAVWEFLAEEVLPAVQDDRLRFRIRVAMNALAIARRELQTGGGGLSEAELADLARRIRGGEVPADALPTLRAHVADKLRVSNPRFLERYR